MRFFELLAYLPNASTRDQDTDITAPVTDHAQSVQPGGLFVARRGATFDGHSLISEVVARGVAAVIGEHPPEQVVCPVPYATVLDAQGIIAPLAAAYHGFPSRQMTVIGVTGTDGKTTTVSMLYHMLRSVGLKVGLISTVQAILGDSETSTGLHITTPRAAEVQGYLAQMVEAGLTHCILETTSHGLAQGRVAAVDFDVAVITNINHEHLDYHGSFEAYRAAKAELFRKLTRTPGKLGTPVRPDSSGEWQQDKVAVINADDPSADLLRTIPADRRLFYSLTDPAADFYAADWGSTANGTRFTVRGQRLQIPFVGRYNSANALAALAAAFAVGVPVAELVEGMATIPPIPGRMEVIDAGQDFMAVVDFAHTPNSLRQVLTTARELVGPDQRVLCVVGSAGLRDKDKRRMMAAIAAELADRVVLTAEDPRIESLDTILDEMAAGCQAQGGVLDETFFRVPDRGRALYEAAQLAGPGDILLACGKGHEQSMCFGETEYPWDDREALRAALQGTPLQTLPTAQADWTE